MGKSLAREAECENLLEKIVLEEKSTFSSLQNDLLQLPIDSSDYLRAIENSVSGRLGERIALHLLQKELKDSAESITWLNENVETTKPFDIFITLKSGEQLYCEVKTRTILTTSNTTWRNQWFMSINEINCAINLQQSYFVCCICIKFDPFLLSVVDQRTIFIGLENGGLIQALKEKQSQLCLQVEKEALL
jgi:hypothetical protein